MQCGPTGQSPALTRRTPPCLASHNVDNFAIAHALKAGEMIP